MRRRGFNILLMLFVLLGMADFGFGAMLYRPVGMWDSWLFRDGDDFHLFYMSGGGIGRAVSKDLIHWSPLPSIPNLASTQAGDKKEMSTGCTVKKDGQYYMFYGLYSGGLNSPVCVLTSPDLIRWHKVSESPVLPAKPPYRAEDNWRDISVYYDEKEGVWHGYLFGVYDKTGSTCIAHVTTKDFMNWQYLEPVFVSERYMRDNNGFAELEVPEPFVLNGRHYMMFCSIRSRKSSTSGLQDASGTWYLIGDEHDGTYRVPERPLILGSGEGRFDHYVGRTIEYKGKRLLYHQVIGNMGKNPVAWGTLKTLCTNSDGALSLKYWPGLDVLRSEKIAVSDKFEVTSEPGFRALKMLDMNLTDMMLTCQIDLRDIKSAAVLFRDQSDSCRESAAGVLIDKDKQVVSMIEAEYWKAYHREFKSRTILTHCKTEYQQPGLIEDQVFVRVLTRNNMAEVYINDQWVFTTDISELPVKGDVGFMADSGILRVSDCEVYGLEPMSDTVKK